MLASRALEPAGRGELALVLQVAYLATLVLLLGTDRSLVATWTGSTAPTALRVQLELLRWPLLAAALAGAVVLVLPLPPLWCVGALGALAFAVVNAGARGLRAVGIASARVPVHVVVTAAGQVALLAAAVGLSATGTGSVGAWTSAYCAAVGVPVVVACWRWLARPGGPRRPADADRVRRARREGLALLPSSLAGAALLRLDRLLLPALASTSALGVYAAVATMTEALAWPVQAAVDARLGVWRAQHEAGSLRPCRFVAAVVVALVVGGAVLAVLASAVVVPALGPGYAAAGDLVLPLVLASGLFGLGQVLLALVIARGRPGAASGAEVAGLLVAAAAHLVLIPREGAAGAALASLLGSAAGLLAAVLVLATSRPGTPVSPAPAEVLR